MRGTARFVIAVLFGVVSCGGGTSIEMVFSDPTEDVRVALRFEGNTRVSVASTDATGGHRQLRGQIFGTGLSRAWVGWSRDSRTVAILACDEGGSQPLSYFSLLRQETIDVEREGVRTAEAAANLMKSLDHLAHRSGWEKKRAYVEKWGLVSWFCSVGELREFESSRTSSTVSYRIPGMTFRVSD